MAQSRGIWLALLFTVGLANAAIMIIELAASQLIARYLGQSLFTWTAIIGVALTGMAAGHLAGGRLSDRIKNTPKLLGTLLVLSAPACAVVLLNNTIAGHFFNFQNASWPLRITIHVGTTFFLPFVMLGTLNPVAARYALQMRVEPGQALGKIYAMAAAGSIAGVFVTGFYLIPRFTIPHIYIGMAMVLGLLGLAILLLQHFSHSISNTDSDKLQIQQTPLHNALASPEKQRYNPYLLWAVLLTAFLSNAAIFTFELSISRMATRHFGHGLYTWTLVLGFVLAGLTLGNLVGGRLADRYPARPLLSLLLGVCALACIGTNGLNNEALNWNFWAKLPWPGQMAGHIFLLSSGASFILGMLGPVIAKHALDIAPVPGVTLGRVYASGALGSVAGTFIAGFGLIAWIGPYATVLGLAVCLAFASMYYQPKMGLAFAGFSVFALISGVAPGGILYTTGNAMGFRGPQMENIIYEDHSHYAWIAVMEDPRTPGRRKLILDSLVHSEARMGAPEELFFRFWWIYEMAIEERWPTPQPLHTMVIGGGGYAFPRYMEITRPESYIEAVEIDSGVTLAAHEAFGFPRDSEVQVYTMDGRNRVAELLDVQIRSGTPPKFDCIIGDSIDQYSVPFQLTTIEFKEKVRALLKEDGIYLMNTTDRVQNGLFLGAVIHSARSVFPYVTAITNRPEHVQDRDSIIVVCSNTPVDANRIVGRIRSKYPSFPGQVLSSAQLDTIVTRSNYRLLKDDYAPVDYLMSYVSDPDPVPSFEEQETWYLSQMAGVRTEIAAGRITDNLTVTLDHIENFMPWHPDVYLVRAELFRAEENNQAAISAIDSALELAPFHAKLYAERGWVHLNMGETEKAHKDFIKSLELDPELETARLGLQALTDL